MAAQPIWQTLAPGGLGIGVIGCAQHCHKDLRGADFAAGCADYRQGRPGIIVDILLALKNEDSYGA